MRVPLRVLIWMTLMKKLHTIIEDKYQMMNKCFTCFCKYAPLGMLRSCIGNMTKRAYSIP